VYRTFETDGSEPEEWFEAKEKSLLKQHVLGSHKQFGGTLHKISEVTWSTKQAARLSSGTECQLLSCKAA
jgi:hypothetical protein